MKFMSEDFLLENKVAKKLYHEYAENLPIIDYHCHISPKEVYEDRKFENITRVWLGGDHYKWRLIRSNGIPEEEITGSASDRVKFQHFAEVLPRTIGNPMYHWSHLELKRYFDIDFPLTEKNAETVWDICNAKLMTPALSVRNIVKNSNVEMIGTTDDPADSLEWHKKIAEDPSIDTKVLPSYRPDKYINIEKEGFVEAIATLSSVCGFTIDNAKALKKALSDRLSFFCEHGCKISDHGMDAVWYRRATDEKLEEIFRKGMAKEALSTEEIEAFHTEIMLHMGREYARHGVVMQLHYGAQRNVNQRLFRKLGPDTGFDCIAGGGDGLGIAKFLNALEEEDLLPKTILYSLDPKDNEMLDTILGAFQGTECPGKIQHGSAWWFNDTKSGMEDQLRSLANLSVLGNFIGMLTDSRSFLSYTRHEYFRRILCNFIGKLVENGEYPEDYEMLGTLVSDISYYNAKRYFELD